MKFFKYLLNALLMISVVGSAKAELSAGGVLLGGISTAVIAGGIAVSHLGENEEEKRVAKFFGTAIGIYGTALLGIVAAVDFSDEISNGISKVANSTMNVSSNMFNNLKTQVMPYLTQAGNTVVEQTKNVKDYLTSVDFINDRSAALEFVKTPAGKIIVAGTLGTIGAGYCVYKICKNLHHISPIKLSYNENFLKINKTDKTDKK